jgi:hypothetical protein
MTMLTMKERATQTTRWLVAVAIFAMATSGCSSSPEPEPGDVSARADGGQADAGADGGANPDVDTRQRTVIDIFGPTELILDLETEQLEPLKRITNPDGTTTATYGSVKSADWNSYFTFLNRHGGLTSLIIHPWVCPVEPTAIDLWTNGAVVTERRMAEIDASGMFWTNGDFGRPFLNGCEYRVANDQVHTTFVGMDGHSFCTEPQRRNTQVVVLDSDGNLVGRPELCIAYTSYSHNSPSEISVSLILESNSFADSGEAPKFKFSIGICPNEENWPPPFEVTGVEEIIDPNCRSGAGLSFAGDDQYYDLAGGTWSIYAASTEHAGVHVSQLDILLTGADGKSFTVKGHVELPQVLE